MKAILWTIRAQNTLTVKLLSCWRTGCSWGLLKFHVLEGLHSSKEVLFTMLLPHLTCTRMNTTRNICSANCKTSWWCLALWAKQRKILTVCPWQRYVLLILCSWPCEIPMQVKIRIGINITSKRKNKQSRYKNVVWTVQLCTSPKELYIKNGVNYFWKLQGIPIEK